MGYHEILKTYKVLDKEETLELIRKAQSGDKKAFDKVFKHNLRLVVRIAHRFNFQFVDLDDLIQEGNIALMRAIELYDESKGVWFITYASMWIRNKIMKYINTKTRAIRLPEPLVLKILRVDKVLDSDDMTIEELSEVLDIDEQEILNVLRLPNVTTLDQKIGEDTWLGDMIASEGTNDEDIDVYLMYLEALISELGVFEEVFLRVRYGLVGSGGKSMAFVSNVMGFTVDELRTIEKKVLKYLSGRVKTVHYV